MTLIADNSKQNALDNALKKYINDFIAGNKAAQTISKGLKVLGIGLRPVIDHITFRTHDVKSRAKEFLDFGYALDTSVGKIKYKKVWAEIYRKHGYPTISLEQPFEGERGKKCDVSEWIKKFGENVAHHIAIQVEDVNQAVFYLEKQGIPFVNYRGGKKGSVLRKVMTSPEIKDGKEYTLLELIERHFGYSGFCTLDLQIS